MATATTEHTKTTYAKGGASFSGSVLLPTNSITLPDGSKAKQAGFTLKQLNCITQLNSSVTIPVCFITKLPGSVTELYSSVAHLFSCNF